jgi:DNA-binding transcriptional MerR regulator
VVINIEYSIGQALSKLFKIELSEHKKLKDSIATLEGKEDGKGVLKPKRIPSPRGGNDKRVYTEEQFDFLHNVIVLQGFFPKPASIREILEKPKKREDQVQYLIEAIGDRTEVGGVQFNSKALKCFLSELQTDFSFKDQKLNNPFIELPQLQEMSVVFALNHEGACAKDVMIMMDCYFSEDSQELERAYEIAQTLNEVTGTAAKYKSMIESRYKDAKAFDNMLDIFKR